MNRQDTEPSDFRARVTAVALCLIASIAASSFAAEPERMKVFSSTQGKFVTFDDLVAALAADADIVLVGEEHEDTATHRIELALLSALHQKRQRVGLSLEMFERDTQTALDAYLGGAIAEDEFLKQARPWKNYQTDYRPLVEYAKANKLPVIASNVPRRLATKVATGKGLSELAGLAAGDAQWVASEIDAPRDGYWWRFRETMRGHEGAEANDASMLAFYEAQCVKDETMAESIARFWMRTAAGTPARTLVVHYNGDFHSDYGEGTALRVRRRVPTASTIVVTIIPVDNLDAANGAAEAGRAAYVIFCPHEK
jgi:uncharacterized iron-regulated protein